MGCTRILEYSENFSTYLSPSGVRTVQVFALIGQRKSREWSQTGSSLKFTIKRPPRRSSTAYGSRELEIVPLSVVTVSNTDVTSPIRRVPSRERLRTAEPPDPPVPGWTSVTVRALSPPLSLSLSPPSSPHSWGSRSSLPDPVELIWRQPKRRIDSSSKLSIPTVDLNETSRDCSSNDCQRRSKNGHEECTK